MGKKAKSIAGIQKAAERKIDKSTLPPPPPPPEEEVGSAKPLEKPALPGSGFKVLNDDGYDDGGVADLSLLIDLEDSVQRRRRGENEYFQALKADLLPRATRGPMAKMTRREQKVSLAQLLFSEDDDCEDKGPSEVYIDQVDGEEDAATMKHRADRLAQAKAALRLSLLLREPACTSLSLSELCKRKLTFSGKKGATDALRCADKALEIAGNGFWDGDEIAIEANDDPVLDPKFEKKCHYTRSCQPSRTQASSHACIPPLHEIRPSSTWKCPCCHGKRRRSQRNLRKSFPSFGRRTPLRPCRLGKALSLRQHW